MIFCTISSPPTKSAPASCASRTFSPPAITSTRTLLPSPFGRPTVPRTTWSECLGSTPRLIANSTVSLNFVRSEEHTSELQSPDHLVCRLLLEKKKQRSQAPPPPSRHRPC